MPSIRHLVRAFKQRALVQWVIGYLAVAWLVLQLFSILADQFSWPLVLTRSLTVLLAIGVVVVIVIGWYHGEQGRQRASALEVIMLAAVVIGAGAALQLVRRTTPLEDFVEPSGLPVPGAPAARTSIAILPFANLSGEQRDNYFADGFTEQLIDAMANVPGIRVASRTSSFSVKERNLDISEIARRLGVRTVLEGSIRRSGDRIRVTAQLINAQDEMHIWSKTYERGTGDVFAVQDELARAIVDALDVTLNEKSSSGPPTRDVEAYDLYLRGVYHYRVDAFRSDSAIHYLERATQRDPKFALAFGALGEAYQARNFNSGDSTAEYRQKAFIAIEKALALDPLQTNALIARGNLAYTLERGFNYQSAAADFRRALEINPASARAHEALGALYHHVGLNERALREFNVARQLDPQSDFAPSRIARTLINQGKFAEALTNMRARPNYERHYQWPITLFYNGRKAEALQAAEYVVSRAANEDGTAVYAMTLAAVGRAREAEEQIAVSVRLGSGRSHFHHAAYVIAVTYALLGKRTEAVQWLRRTAREGMPNYELFLNDPHLDSLRDDREFRRFMDEQRRLWEHHAEIL